MALGTKGRATSAAAAFDSAGALAGGSLGRADFFGADARRGAAAFFRVLFLRVGGALRAGLRAGFFRARGLAALREPATLRRVAAFLRRATFFFRVALFLRAAFFFRAAPFRRATFFRRAVFFLRGADFFLRPALRRAVFLRADFLLALFFRAAFFFVALRPPVVRAAFRRVAFFFRATFFFRTLFLRAAIEPSPRPHGRRDPRFYARAESAVNAGSRPGSAAVASGRRIGLAFPHAGHGQALRLGAGVDR